MVAGMVTLGFIPYNVACAGAVRCGSWSQDAHLVSARRVGGEPLAA